MAVPKTHSRKNIVELTCPLVSSATKLSSCRYPLSALLLPAMTQSGFRDKCGDKQEFQKRSKSAKLNELNTESRGLLESAVASEVLDTGLR